MIHIRFSSVEQHKDNDFYDKQGFPCPGISRGGSEFIPKCPLAHLSVQEQRFLRELMRNIQFIINILRIQFSNGAH
jgi:hypothetical protein